MTFADTTIPSKQIEAFSEFQLVEWHLAFSFCKTCFPGMTAVSADNDDEVAQDDPEDAD